MTERVTITWGGRTLTLETGRLAKQANGAVLVTYGESVVLVSAVTSRTPREGRDFFPLTVDYQEMTYAAGKIPGGFFKREGRPSEKEVLTSRFIDRPLRPLFPKNYFNDVQIIATVLSADSENNPDILAIIGASAALEISDIPFYGPIAGTRVGRINGQLTINPSFESMKDSDLEIIVAGSEEAVVMVEGGANILPEDEVLEAIMFGHRSMQEVIALQKELRKRVGKTKIVVPEESIDSALIAQVEQRAADRMRAALAIAAKQERNNTLHDVVAETIESLLPEHEEKKGQIRSILDSIEKRIIREQITRDKKRIDGRSFTDIRSISCDVDVLPRTHGSALFTRGETQALVSTTLGTSADEQRIDALIGEMKKSFMLHYNFPPFSVGEARPLRSPSRRDIGHGALAERAIAKVLPRAEDFPYTIRIVSEILESNGSSSMATVCGSALSLMDAGVPITMPVAGIAMGLIKEGNDFIILSDILGDEDHIGDMDFKVAGTRSGITAIQMDIKITGLTRDILSSALNQAREGRLFILDIMQQTLKEPRPSLSARAPKIITIQVRPDKVRDVIGPGGKNIRNIIAQTGAKIDVEDDGKVNIASADSASLEKAMAMIKELVQDAEIGQVYLGKVRKIMDFGAFVEILPGLDGLVHISQLDDTHVKNVRDVLNEGDEVLVKVLDIDQQGKIKLSRKEAMKGNQTPVNK
ncbi:MAG: polyribonucleotide nucleotidyltransferase [Proteobacteria bacterium]|nr:polyribonucleotide nucleotidyltransferase [Pseudomonadota bacterium]